MDGIFYGKSVDEILKVAQDVASLPPDSQAYVCGYMKGVLDALDKPTQTDIPTVQD